AGGKLSIHQARCNSMNHPFDRKKKSSQRLFATFVSILLLSVAALAQTSAFTYQGKLNISGTPATGTYDIQFKLFDALSGNNQYGITLTNSAVVVTNGIFSVELDFEAGAFDGSPRYLEIGVRQAGDPNPYTVLAPRQAINSTPYAIRSANATAADALSPAC